VSPTIRVDDEVYRWLQSQAVPFEDSPNSVLKRLAGLDQQPVPGGETGASESGHIGAPAESTEPKPVPRVPESTSQSTTMARQTNPPPTRVTGRRTGRRAPLARGRELVTRWGLPARQARFHRDGYWYDGPNIFPAALCDCRGYILFESEDDFRTTPGVRIEPSGQVWVPGGIATVVGYRRTDDPIEDPEG
jgi:hypothetical protein